MNIRLPHVLFLIGILFFEHSLSAQTCKNSSSSSLANIAQSVQSICQEAGAPGAGQITASTCTKALVKKGETTNTISSFPAEIHMGDLVTCEGDGKIEITFKNETKLTIFANSSLLIEEYLQRESNIAKVLLSRLNGSVKLLVNPNKGPQDVNIRTFTAGIAVRGTEFEVSQTLREGAEEVTVKTLHGKVAVKNNVTHEEKMVTAGFQLKTSGKTMTLTKTNP